jgi:antitoxin HicB
MKKKNIGSSFDSWLNTEGICEDVTATAVKRGLTRRDFPKVEATQRLHRSKQP